MCIADGQLYETVFVYVVPNNVKLTIEYNQVSKKNDILGPGEVIYLSESKNCWVRSSTDSDLNLGGTFGGMKKGSLEINYYITIIS